MSTAEPRWLLRVYWAGRYWYVASTPTAARGGCVPVDDAGRSIPHLETLAAVEWSESISWTAQSTGEAKASVSFTLPCDVAALVAQGHHLYLAECELSLWTPGESYDARTKVLRGRLVPAEIPFLGEPITGSIEEPPWLTGAVWPPPAAIISTSTWSTVPDDGTGVLLGTRYPFVFGKPGAYVDDAGVSGSYNATPAYPVDLTGGSEKLLACGAPVVATTVTVYSVADDDSASLPVSTSTDGLGRAVAIIDASGKTGVWTVGLDATNPGTFFVTGWGDGGIQSPDGSGCIQGAGELALYLLRQRLGVAEEHRVDAAAWSEARLHVDACRVAGYLDETADPWALTNSQLLPMMPALYVSGGPGGLRAVVFRDTPSALCRSLTVGRELHRASGARPKYGSGLGLTEFTVYFARNNSTQDFQATATLNADTDSRAAAALTRFPGGRADKFEAPLIADRASAEWVASEQIRLRWAPERTDELWCPLAVGRHIRQGERLRITDEQAGYVDRLFWVAGRAAGRAAKNGLMVLGLVDVP